MIAQREYINVHFSVTNGINQAVFVVNTATPLAVCSFQSFRFTQPRKRMLKNIFKQCSDTFKYARISLLFPITQVVFGLWKQYYFHISSNVTTRPRPFLISSSPWRRTSTISGEDMIYSVSSIVCFWAVILLRALMAFFIMPSSSEMMLNSRNNSAFNCSAVITSSNFLGGKDTINKRNKQIKRTKYDFRTLRQANG